MRKLILLFAALFLFGCGSDSREEPPAPKITVPAKFIRNYTIVSYSAKNILISHDVKNYHFTVKSNNTVEGNSPNGAISGNITSVSQDLSNLYITVDKSVMYKIQTWSNQQGANTEISFNTTTQSGKVTFYCADNLE